MAHQQFVKCVKDYTATYYHGKVVVQRVTVSVSSLLSVLKVIQLVP